MSTSENRQSFNLAKVSQMLVGTATGYANTN